jgi:hypothetical protein
MDTLSQSAVAIKELPVRSQALLGFSIFLVLFYTARLISSRPERLNLPVIKIIDGDYKNAIMEGVVNVCAASSILNMG